MHKCAAQDCSQQLFGIHKFCSIECQIYYEAMNWQEDVVIPEIVETSCVLYRNLGLKQIVVGRISSYLQLTDVRIQIARKKLIGYFIKWNYDNSENFDIININEYGTLDHWPEGFFTIMDEQLDELIGLQYPSKNGVKNAN